MSLIQVNNAAFGYDGKAILKEVSFSVNTGDYLCIVGENGSGKSTLIKTILGLIKPIAGTITFGDGLKQNQIGYLPQQTEVQKDFPASVWEIVLSGCLNQCGMRPYYNKLEKNTAKKNMERLDIYKLSNKCYRELSGGQQQRVLLARALCATQKILLLDEPVAGLDPQATERMYTLIKELNEKSNITIIMISHDITTATEYAKHVLCTGNNVFWGDTKQYLTHFKKELAEVSDA